MAATKIFLSFKTLFPSQTHNISLYQNLLSLTNPWLWHRSFPSCKVVWLLWKERNEILWGLICWVFYVGEITLWETFNWGVNITHKNTTLPKSLSLWVWAQLCYINSPTSFTHSPCRTSTHMCISNNLPLTYESLPLFRLRDRCFSWAMNKSY